MHLAVPPSWYSTPVCDLTAYLTSPSVLPSSPVGLHCPDELVPAATPTHPPTRRHPGDTEAARGLYTAALAACPTYPAAHYNLGVLHSEARRWEEALAAYGAALEAAPRYAQAHCNRGVILKELGRLEEAVAAYEAAAVVGRGGGVEGWLELGVGCLRQRWRLFMLGPGCSMSVRWMWADSAVPVGAGLVAAACLACC
jgi:hypothetical protein